MIYFGDELGYGVEGFIGLRLGVGELVYLGVLGGVRCASLA